MSTYVQNGPKASVRTVGELRKALDGYDDGITLMDTYHTPCTLSFALMQDEETGDNQLQLDEIDDDQEDEET